MGSTRAAVKTLRVRLKPANSHRHTLDVPLKTGNEAFGLFVMFVANDLGQTGNVEQDIQSVLDFKTHKELPAHLRPITTKKRR